MQLKTRIRTAEITHVRHARELPNTWTKTGVITLATPELMGNQLQVCPAEEVQELESAP